MDVATSWGQVDVAMFWGSGEEVTKDIPVRSNGGIGLYPYSPASCNPCLYVSADGRHFRTNMGHSWLD